MKKYMKKVLVAILAASLFMITFIPSANAAEEPNTPKEEVVYVGLNADGSVREINVVNIFELDETGHIVDYGEYESIRNMTTTDTLYASGGKISADIGAGKLYYEGKLDENVMPWNISIHYYIDGKEYSADDAAGNSGAFKMTVSVTENTSCRGSFFEGYALQASLTLNGGKFTNIVADGATVANVGADKQLTYIILPGKGAELTVTADVTDFEIDGFSINGIPLSLEIEVDDSELNSEIKRLLEAIKTIDDGAEALYDGADKLQTGVDSAIGGGVDELVSGVDKLHAGAGELLSGGKALEKGAVSLYEGAAALDSGVKKLSSGISQIEAALDALDSSSSALTDGSSGIRSALLTIKAALGSVSVSAGEIGALTAASSKVKTGIDMLAASSAELRQAVSYDAYCATMSAQGLDIEELRNNNTAAIEELQTTISSLMAQIAAMKAAGLDTAALEAQVAQLTNVAALLAANNANITGIEAYLDTLGSNMDVIVAGTSQLSAEYAEFDLAITSLADTLSSLLYNVSALSGAVNTLVAEYEKLDAGIGEYAKSVAAIAAGAKTISASVGTLVTGSGAVSKGANDVYGGAGELVDGLGELYSGTDALGEGADAFGAALPLLTDAISTVRDGAEALKGGTSAMREETTGLDSKVGEKIDDMIGSLTGKGGEITSFVSDSNTEVKGVQFVIKADGIHAEIAAENDPAVTEELTFWQKLLRLFGLY